MSSCLCDQCSALCCRYFVLEIDKPEDAEGYDNIRWYLVHEKTFVFIEKKKWYLGVYAKCKHLQLDNRCGIYETRPKICRKYTTDNCDYHGGEYNWEILFSSAEQFQTYALEKLAEMREEKREKAKRKRLREAAKLRKNGTAREQKPVARLAKKTTKSKRTKKRGRSSVLPVLMAAGVMGSGPSNVDRAPTNGNGNGRGVSLPVLGGRR